jgi:hypothetical protein
MFAYCGNDPINYTDPSGAKRKFWFQLFEDHRPGYIHESVQWHILLKYNFAELLYEKEFYLPGIGRADIVKLSTGEVWEIKHAGSTTESEMSAMSSACTQLLRYTGNETSLHTGKAGAFSGYFIINFDNTSYLINYETPDAGVVLYYVNPTTYTTKPELIYSSTHATSRKDVYSSMILLGFASMGLACGGHFSIRKAAYAN